MPSFTGRCMKEKADVKIPDGKYIVNARGGIALQGKCPKCGTTVTRFTAVATAPPEIRAQAEKVKATNKKKAGSGQKKSRASRKSGRRSRH